MKVRRTTIKRHPIEKIKVALVNPLGAPVFLATLVETCVKHFAHKHGGLALREADMEEWTKRLVHQGWTIQSITGWYELTGVVIGNTTE